jgi:hypothetical protein
VLCLFPVKWFCEELYSTFPSRYADQSPIYRDKQRKWNERVFPFFYSSNYLCGNKKSITDDQIEETYVRQWIKQQEGKDAWNQDRESRRQP